MKETMKQHPFNEWGIRLMRILNAKYIRPTQWAVLCALQMRPNSTGLQISQMIDYDYTSVMHMLKTLCQRHQLATSFGARPAVYRLTAEGSDLIAAVWHEVETGENFKQRMTAMRLFSHSQWGEQWRKDGEDQQAA